MMIDDDKGRLKQKMMIVMMQIAEDDKEPLHRSGSTHLRPGVARIITYVDSLCPTVGPLFGRYDQEIYLTNLEVAISYTNLLKTQCYQRKHNISWPTQLNSSISCCVDTADAVDTADTFAPFVMDLQDASASKNGEESNGETPCLHRRRGEASSFH